LIIGFAAVRLLKLYRIQAERIRSLQNQLSAICAGASGTDERILRFEQALSTIKAHQHAMDISSPGKQSYDHAIRLAKKGVSTEQLIDNCNLSDEEAHVIKRIHGQSQHDANLTGLH